MMISVEVEVDSEEVLGELSDEDLIAELQIRGARIGECPFDQMIIALRRAFAERDRTYFEILLDRLAPEPPMPRPRVSTPPEMTLHA
ncbi:MAG TPA: hypothetical protein VNE67_09155 [Acetobacteraceae bacterium]|nr:hypothetical protein [Acetobacteraceae bacterium]